VTSLCVSRQWSCHAAAATSTSWRYRSCNAAPIGRTVRLDSGQTLEARLEARFAALEAQFTAFEVRAGNGFGMFPESGDDATSGDQAGNPVVSTSQQPITTTQHPGANDDSPIVRAQKAKVGKGDRTKERKGKPTSRKPEPRNRR
jgi:hypothetical protein